MRRGGILDHRLGHDERIGPDEGMPRLIGVNELPGVLIPMLVPLNDWRPVQNRMLAVSGRA